MSIKYKIGHARLGGEDKTFPQLIPGETTRGEAFTEKLAQRAARGPADVVAVLTAMREVILEELREEQAVRIPGIGTLSLSLKGELDEKQRLVPATAKLRINFRPGPDLREAVNVAQRFEYVGE